MATLKLSNFPAKITGTLKWYLTVASFEKNSSHENCSEKLQNFVFPSSVHRVDNNYCYVTQPEAFDSTVTFLKIKFSGEEKRIIYFPQNFSFGLFYAKEMLYSRTPAYLVTFGTRGNNANKAYSLINQFEFAYKNYDLGPEKMFRQIKW